MGARHGGNLRSTILLTVCVVATFFVVAFGGWGPAYASHCTGDSDQDYETASNCIDHDDYEDDGNYKCSEAEKLTDGDLDGDGTDDCDDPDDDGDHLSDKLERELTPSDYRDKNSDLYEDGIPDGLDIVPAEFDGAFATITAATYKPPSTTDPNDCGDGGDLPDPYIPDGELEISYGKDDLDLVPPEGWEEDYTNDAPNDGDDDDDLEDDRPYEKFEDGHWHERPANNVSDLVLDDGDDAWGNGNVTDNKVNLPDNVTEYPNDGFPSVTLQIGLKDHDVTWHDRMDISPGGGTIAEFEPFPLTIDDGARRDEGGDGGGDCDKGNAELGFDFTDTADKDAVRAAVYHRDNPTDPVVQASDLT